MEALKSDFTKKANSKEFSGLNLNLIKGVVMPIARKDYICFLCEEPKYICKPYFVYTPASFCEPDPAILVFAHRATQAKSIAYQAWPCEVNFIDLRVKLIRENTGYWFSFADKKKLEKGIPHIAVEEPPFCEICGAYLNPDGTCPLCNKCEEVLA